MTGNERAVIISILIVGVVFIIAWVLIGMQDACLSYRATNGLTDCWLPFGE
jgi:hypothetical protein